MPPSGPKPGPLRPFRNNRSQAIRIPVEFELPGTPAMISRDGSRVIIEPIQARGLVALLDSWAPLDEDFPDIADPPPPLRDIF